MTNENVLFKYVVDRRLAKLAEQITAARRAIEASSVAEGAARFAADHLELAEEHYQDAVSALKYNNPAQAFLQIEPGILAADLAKRLVSAAARAPNRKRQSDKVEEKLSNLASALSKIKAIIEYKNYSVGELPRRYLDLAMERYNHALRHFRANDKESTDRQVQAGVLCVHLAERLLNEANEPISGIGALANPRIARPLRQLLDLSKDIARLGPVYELHREESKELRDSYSRALSNFESAVQAVADANNQSTHAYTVSARESLEMMRDRLGQMGTLESTNLTRKLTNTDLAGMRARLDGFVSEVKDFNKALTASTTVRKKHIIRDRLDKICHLHRQAVTSLDNGRTDRARQLISSALLEIDLLKTSLRRYSPDHGKEPQAQ